MRPRVFWLHVHHFDAAGGRVWAVQTAGKYLTAASIDVRVPLATVFRGRRARQPRAYLRGRGVVRHRAGIVTIKGGMMAFIGRRLTLWERFWFWCNPAARREHDRRQRAIMREIVSQPDEPVLFR